MEEHKIDRRIALVLVGVGVFVLIATKWQVPFREDLSAHMSPRFFPIFSSCLLIFLGIVTFIFSLKSKVSLETSHAVDKTEVKRIGLFILIFVLYSFSMYKFGYLIPTSLTLGITMVFFGSRSWGKILIFMILVPFIIFIIFSKWLNIVVPESVLESLILGL